MRYEDLKTAMPKALETYKKTRADYIKSPCKENWVKFCEAKRTCMLLGVRIQEVQKKNQINGGTSRPVCRYKSGTDEQERNGCKNGINGYAIDAGGTMVDFVGG